MRKKCVIPFLLFLLVWQIPAVKPDFSPNGYLLLYKESGDQNFSIKAKAIIAGVESWYYTYEWMISQYINSGSFYQYIFINGFWSNTYITPRVLAEQIHKDWNIDLWDVPSEVIDMVEGAIIDERTYGSSGITYFDPIWFWKWRSVYMESMYKENDFFVCEDRNANCWGTADYLAMDDQWARRYMDYYPNGVPQSKLDEQFPNIYLDGSAHDLAPCDYEMWFDYYIDFDLDPTEFRADFKGHRYSYASGPNPKTLLNAFDIVRYSIDPEGQYAFCYEMYADDVNIGHNLHCVAYICTDVVGTAWVYEKHNWGCTKNNPYGLNTVRKDIWTEPTVENIGDYEQSYVSFFKKYGFNKKNIADNYNLNWAGITP